MSFQLIRHPQPILEKNLLQPWEAGSVLNPTVIEKDGTYHMFYRATNGVDRDKHGRYMSAIGHAVSEDGIHFRRDQDPFIVATEPYENGRGCEDPRVTYIDGVYYFYYTAVEKGEGDAIIVRLALATSIDLKTVTKHGIIGPHGTRSKAGCLLPEKVNGKYVMYFTDMADSPSSTILATLLDSTDEILEPHKKILTALDDYDSATVLKSDPFKSVFRGPELGAVPIKTDAGWLLIYCGANHTDHREWTIDAALLDLNLPTKVIAHMPEPILTPMLPDERNGVADNAAFPSGAVVIDGRLYIYYGSGDQDIRLATCKLRDLLDELAHYPTSNNFSTD